MSDTVTRTILTLDVTNAAVGQELLVGLLKRIDENPQLDYEAIAAQLEYAARYARKKHSEKFESELYASAAKELLK